MNIGVWFFLTVVAAISNTAADNDICTKSLRIDVMRECSGNEDPEEEKRKHESDIDSCNEPVKNITVCQKTLNITFINLPPFSDLLIPCKNVSLNPKDLLNILHALKKVP